MRSSASTRLPAIRISSCALTGSFGLATRSCTFGSSRCVLTHVVQGQVEGVEIAQAAPGGDGKAPVAKHGHALLGQPAVRAQGLVQARQVVQLRRGTKRLVATGDDD